MRMLLLLALPIALLAFFAVFRALRGRPLSRHSLNILSALLLLVYFFATAGLGIFWVANQQLPVFDLHYLFGYFTLLLVLCHLVFNLRVVRVWFAVKGGTPAAARPLAPAAARIGLFLLWGALAFYLGLRQGRSRFIPATRPATQTAAALPSGDIAAVLQHHEQTSDSLLGTLTRSPSVNWGAPPPPHKEYPGAPVISLPAPPDPPPAPVSQTLRGAVAPRAGPFTLAELSALLHHTDGITDRRWGLELHAAPTSGALHPVEIYLLAREVTGLAPGIYHYDSRSHRLQRLREGESSEALFAAAGRRELRDAPVTFALTAVLRRTAAKYGDRAYRYAAADAGHAALNLRAGAAGLGFASRLIGRFDDGEVNRLLGIDGVEESALLLVPVGAVGTAAPEASGGWEFLLAGEAPGSVTGAAGLAQTVTSLRRIAQERNPERQTEKVTPAGTEENLPLALPGESPQDIFALIRARRSQRKFTEQALRPDDLSALLRSAVAPAATGDDALSVEGAVGLAAWIVILKPGGLEPGVYRYYPEGHRLERIRPGNHRRESYRAALSQEVVGGAAAWLVLAGDRERMFGSHGARGYRYALLNAGLAGEAVYLEAGGRGLGVCSVGAFYEPEINTLIGADPARYLVLHTVAIGVPEK